MTSRARHRGSNFGYQPRWSDPCPCGSARTFPACCRSRLPGTEAIDKAWREAAGAGDWETALLLVRADVAQYVIWHRRHTIPSLQIPGYSQADMYSIDVAALSEHVGNLVEVLYRLRCLNQAPAILARLRSVIDDERWRRKVAYHRALAALLAEDRPKAREELAVAGPITVGEEDVDLLQIHIDLNGSELGFTERQSLYLRIVEITRSRSDKIQYRGAAAFDLLLLGDEKGGKAAIEAAVEAGRALEAEKPLSPAAESWFCRSLETLAVIDRDPAKFKELVERLTRLLKTGAWTDEGRAALLRSIGDARRFAGEFKLAIEAYSQSFGLAPDGIVRVYQAESLLRDGSVSEALDFIRGVSTDGLDQAKAADHAFVFFSIALAAKDVAALREADRLLRAAVTPHPYFQTQRLQHIVMVQDALAALAEQGEPPKIGGLLRALSTLSRYVQLQPNFNGLGVNINNIIDDAVERAELKARDKVAAR